ncbi:MAG: LPS export ABC transporter permease LptF [Pseudomonadota bacterium]
MFKILNRYVFKEAFASWLSVTGILLFILLSNQFARVLGDAAKDKIPKDAVFEVIGLTALQYLTIIVPFGLFLAIMLAMARLYQDSEMPAMMACRVSPGSLYWPLGWLALPLALLVGYLSVVTGPEAIKNVERIGAEAKRKVDLAAIEPGRFIQSGPDGAVIYAERIEEDGSLKNVFVERRSADNRVELVVAQRGYQRISSDSNRRFIVLENGQRYEGSPGSTEFRIFDFEEHGIPYLLPMLDDIELEPEAMTLRELLDRPGPASWAEIQWRLSIPIAVLVLAFLAVPLARSQPRQGRYGKLAFGVLIYIIYFNLLGAAKVWVEQEKVSPWLGMWWVHVLLIVMALLLFAFQYGYFSRLKARTVPV